MILQKYLRRTAWSGSNCSGKAPQILENWTAAGRCLSLIDKKMKNWARRENKITEQRNLPCWIHRLVSFWERGSKSRTIDEELFSTSKRVHSKRNILLREEFFLAIYEKSHCEISSSDEKLGAKSKHHNSAEEIVKQWAWERCPCCGLNWGSCSYIFFWILFYVLNSMSLTCPKRRKPGRKSQWTHLAAKLVFMLIEFR